MAYELTRARADDATQNPWTAEISSLNHLADDTAISATQAMMLRNCARRMGKVTSVRWADNQVRCSTDEVIEVPSAT